MLSTQNRLRPFHIPNSSFLRPTQNPELTTQNIPNKRSSSGHLRETQRHAPPHFHVRYGEHKAIITVDTLTLLEGHLPPRAFGLVAEWGALHQDELREDWRLAEERAPLKKIKPLE